MKLVPDYILKVENNFAWILDAIAPNKRIVNDENVEQVYSYAIHPEIRTAYFALCNGVEFSLFRSSNLQQPVLFFSVADIENHWATLAMYLSPNSFQTGKNFTCEILQKQQQFDCANRPLLEEIPVKNWQQNGISAFMDISQNNRGMLCENTLRIIQSRAIWCLTHLDAAELRLLKH